ncbi:nucleotidyl transferase AbiEii/AbiGii toxin family protein [Dyella sp.]|uniref:nucleotidyl transferase AbiEii/AbiGii toxin family protein n=1 Tax=Dyella sp. TaxID=1869338 RepID=UPI0039C85614
MLQCGEYRESVVINFLCADAHGYRMLREAIALPTLGNLMRYPVKYLRDVRTDRDKISTILEVDGAAIKFELVREARIELEESSQELLGIPLIEPVDAYAEKLLANTDRGLDKATLSRDMIDLAMMIDKWGPIPPRAFEKAEAAYGASILKAWNRSVQMLSDDAYLANCLQTMSMDIALAGNIRRHLEHPWGDGALAIKPHG